MSTDDDPVEYTGTTNEKRADPIKSKTAKPAPTPQRPEPIAPQPSARVAKKAPAPSEEPEANCDPFDQFGNIVSPPAAIVAKLSPEKKSSLMALLKASVEATDAEKALSNTEKQLYAAVADAQRKHVEAARLLPKTTRVDELRRCIAAQNGHPLPPVEIDARAEAAAIAADEADALSATLRADLETARRTLKSRRATLADEVLRWQKFQQKLDVGDLVRENAKREIERKLARVAQGLSPNEEVERPRPRWPIEVARPKPWLPMDMRKAFK